MQHQRDLVVRPQLLRPQRLQLRSRANSGELAARPGTSEVGLDDVFGVGDEASLRLSWIEASVAATAALLRARSRRLLAPTTATASAQSSVSPDEASVPGVPGASGSKDEVSRPRHRSR